MVLKQLNTILPFKSIKINLVINPVFLKESKVYIPFIHVESSFSFINEDSNKQRYVINLLVYLLNNKSTFDSSLSIKKKKAY
jgi:hypothetical protein